MENQTGAMVAPLGPAIELSEGDSASKKGKSPKKRLAPPPAAANPPSVQTRAQAKKLEQDGEQPPPNKKKRLFVKGTLGSGENAIQTQPNAREPVKTAGSARHDSVVGKPLSVSSPDKNEPAQAVKDTPITSIPQSAMDVPVSPNTRVQAAPGGPLPSPLIGEDVPQTQYTPAQPSGAPVTLIPQTPSTPSQPVSGTNKYNFQVTAEQLKFLQSLLGPSVPEPLSDKEQPQGVSLPTPETTPMKSNGFAQVPMADILSSSPSAVRSRSPSPAPSTPSPSKKVNTVPALEHDGDEASTVPPGCEVTNPATQDAMLAPQYQWLTPLSHVGATSITGEIPSGFYGFSYWTTHIPDIDIDSVMSAVAFANHGRNVNLARCNPAILRHKETKNGARIRRDVMFNDELALCFTTVFVRKSNVIERNPATGQKTLSGIPHSQEIDRLLAAIGMVLKVDQLRVNFYQSSVSFNTYGRSATSTGTFSGFKSSIVSGTVRPRLATLNYTDPIFVFDARDWAFSLEDLLRQLDQQPEHLTIDKKMQTLGFGLFQEELPRGSCAVVAHTITGSMEQGKYDAFTVNFNIQFVILLGIPPPGQDIELTSSP